MEHLRDAVCQLGELSAISNLLFCSQLEQLLIFLQFLLNQYSVSPVFNVHSPFSNASFQIKDNKRKMGPALPILQNLDCVDQIWIKINHPSLVSSNIFVPLVKIGFFVRQYHSCTFSFKLALYYSSSFIPDSKYPNTFHYRILCSIVFTFSVKIPIFKINVEIF